MWSWGFGGGKGDEVTNCSIAHTIRHLLCCFRCCVFFLRWLSRYVSDSTSLITHLFLCGALPRQKERKEEEKKIPCFSQKSLLLGFQMEVQGIVSVFSWLCGECGWSWGPKDYYGREGNSLFLFFFSFALPFFPLLC